MAKPKKSKLLDISQGQQTRKRNPKTAENIPKAGEDAIEEVAAVATSSSGSENLDLNTLRLQKSSRSSLITPRDPDADNPAAVSSRPGSLSSHRVRKLADLAQASNHTTSRTSIPSLRGKTSSVIGRKLRQLNQELQNSDSSIPYIYTLRKQPKSEEIPIKQQSRVEIDISSDSEEEESERSAEDTDLADDNVQSDGGKSNLTSDNESLRSEASDQDIRVRFDLLKIIENFPDWDEFVADSSKDISLESESGVDKGWYRDPLAPSSSTTQVDDDEWMDDEYGHVSGEGARSEPASDASSPPMLSSSELESDEEVDWTVKRPGVEVDPTPNFWQDIHVASTDSSEMQHKERPVPSETYETLEIYLHELVDKVVECVEEGELRLAKNLDKHKLLERLCAEIEDNQNERCNNEFLNKRLTEFHLRHFKYSLVTPTSSSMNETNYRRYHAALNELDFWLIKEQEAQRISLTERYRMQQELEKRQSQDEQEIKRLEDLIREELLSHSRSSERLPLVMDNVFRQMRKKRDEISETRLDLIHKQHNNSYVMQKLKETETISEGLVLPTYLAAEVDVQKLIGLLSAKTAELGRLYSEITSKVHAISHLRCRRKLLSRNFRVAKEELLQLEEKHHGLRAKIYQINMRHNKILAQIKEVRWKGGLQHYPLLLKDYDKTNKIVIARRERVSLIRAYHDSLLEKVKEVESATQPSRQDKK